MLPVSVSVTVSAPKPVNPSVVASPLLALAPYKVFKSDKDPLIVVALTAVSYTHLTLPTSR